MANENRSENILLWLNGKYDRGIMPSSQKKKSIKLLRFGERNFYTYYEQRMRRTILFHSEFRRRDQNYSSYKGYLEITKSNDILK